MAVLAKVKEAQKKIDEGLSVFDDRRTTADYLQWWSDTVLPGTVKPRTLVSYRQVLNDYVIPTVGGRPLAKLSTTDVRTMLRELEVQKLSPRTRQYARAVLRRALQLALIDGLVPRNVAALVEGPKKGEARLDDAMSADEAGRVLKAAKGDRLEALAVVILTLGLRRGEALALRWDGVDLKRGSLKVDGSLGFVPGQGMVLSKPKTAAGARTIPLVGPVRVALKARLEAQGVERLKAGQLWIDDGWVFTTEYGRALDARNALRWWHALTVEAGVGRRRMHAGRHTAATLMLDRGVPLELVSAVLGHAGLAITADVYARPTADAKRRALKTLASALEPRPPRKASAPRRRSPRPAT
jgi:integrase